MCAGTQIASGLLNTAAALALVPLASSADIGAFGTGFGEELLTPSRTMVLALACTAATTGSTLETWDWRPPTHASCCRLVLAALKTGSSMCLTRALVGDRRSQQQQQPGPGRALASPRRNPCLRPADHASWPTPGGPLARPCLDPHLRPANHAGRPAQRPNPIPKRWWWHAHDSARLLQRRRRVE